MCVAVCVCKSNILTPKMRSRSTLADSFRGYRKWRNLLHIVLFAALLLFISSSLYFLGTPMRADTTPQPITLAQPQQAHQQQAQQQQQQNDLQPLYRDADPIEARSKADLYADDAASDDVSRRCSFVFCLFVASGFVDIFALLLCFSSTCTLLSLQKKKSGKRRAIFCRPNNKATNQCTLVKSSLPHPHCAQYSLFN